MRIYLHENDSGQTFAKQLMDMNDGKLPIDPAIQHILFPSNFYQIRSLIAYIPFAK